MYNFRKHLPKMICCHIYSDWTWEYTTKVKTPDLAQMQQVIDDGLPILNAAIDSIDMNTDVKGPWLTDTIHSLTNGRSLRPDESTCKLCAQKFVKVIENNI